jgi:hypothetical protein
MGPADDRERGERFHARRVGEPDGRVPLFPIAVHVLDDLVDRHAADHGADPHGYRWPSGTSSRRRLGG